MWRLMTRTRKRAIVAAGDVVIAAGSTVDGFGRGFSPGKGLASATVGTTQWNLIAGSGTWRGWRGIDRERPDFAGPAYGSALAPTTLGSGGWNGSTYAPGGGAVKIVASADVTGGWDDHRGDTGSAGRSAGHGCGLAGTGSGGSNLDPGPEICMAQRLA